MLFNEFPLTAGNLGVEDTADALEEPVENIRKICRIAEQYVPEYPAQAVCLALMK